MIDPRSQPEPMRTLLLSGLTDDEAAKAIEVMRRFGLSADTFLAVAGPRSVFVPRRNGHPQFTSMIARINEEQRQWSARIFAGEARRP